MSTILGNLKVFADMHHLGLFNSLKMLFEDRLGGTLFRPIGHEWLDDGYWKMAEIYNNHPATVAQYLGYPLNDTEKEYGWHRIWEPQHGFWENAITLEKFREIKPDFVIATIPEHIKTFKLLADEVGAKLIYQIGNAWPVEAGLAPNIMASAKISNVPSDINFAEYHQEFPLSIFKPDWKIKPDKKIRSFVNCFNTASIYQNDWSLFERMEKLMGDWKFESLGGSCRDGCASGQKEVADKMLDSKFIWQTKWAGDGYGHVIYNASAVGRPLIVKKQYYTGKMGEELMVDGETCITIDGLSENEILNKINYYSEEEKYKDMCKKTYKNFVKKVNFDDEEVSLVSFLSKSKL